MGALRHVVAHGPAVPVAPRDAGRLGRGGQVPAAEGLDREQRFVVHGEGSELGLVRRGGARAGDREPGGPRPVPVAVVVGLGLPFLPEGPGEVLEVYGEARQALDGEGQRGARWG